MDQLILHLIATIKYRFDYAISNANVEYYQLNIGKGTRTPLEIIHHMRGLMYYSAKVITGDRTPMADITSWQEELRLFYESIAMVKDVLSQNTLLPEDYLKLTQGPLSDALTHIGQLSMMSRLNDNPIPKQNFVHAKI